MEDKNNLTADKEAILLALDQLSQTMEIMGQVVSRLKNTIGQTELNDQLAAAAMDQTRKVSDPVKANTENKTFSSEGVVAQSFVLH